MITIAHPGFYGFKVNNLNIKAICSKLIKRHQNKVNDVDDLQDFTHCLVVSTIDFKQVNAGWVPRSIIDKVSIRADVHLFIAIDPTFTCSNSPMQTPEQ